MAVSTAAPINKRTFQFYLVRLMDPLISLHSYPLRISILLSTINGMKRGLITEAYTISILLSTINGFLRNLDHLFFIPISILLSTINGLYAVVRVAAEVDFNST